MKHVAFILFAGLFLTTGCQPNKDADCTPTTVTTKAPDTEIAALKQYIDTQKITATFDPRGFYYNIQSPGSGDKPTVCSTVTVNYAGKLTTGQTFDSGSGVRFGLSQLIVGWQEGIPLVAAGGSVTLYLPPSLAYGSQEQQGIPANSILVFQIDLVKAE